MAWGIAFHHGREGTAPECDAVGHTVLYSQRTQERKATAQLASPSPTRSGIARDSTVSTQGRSSLLRETSLEIASQA